MHAMTMGIATIMDSQRLIMLAMGKTKANAIKMMVEGPVSEMCPASILQLHPHATVAMDEDAASELESVDYHRQVFEQKG